MALEGTLRDFSFADILQLISLQRKTGVLTLKDEDKLVTISFLDGCIVGSSSLNHHTEDRIGLILLKRGELTEAELEAALKRQEETLQRLGRILIDHHVVSAETIREALEQQILQIVFRVFRWSDGEYHFSQETDIDYDRDLMRPMAADSVIMEGARMTDEWPLIDKRLADRSVVYIKVEPARTFEIVEEEDEDFDDLGFNFSESPEESAALPVPDDRMTRHQLTVYELVNGRDNVHELILESPLIEFETCKAVADLIERGLIRPATQEEVVWHLSRQAEPVQDSSRSISLPWLAVPALALLLFSFAIARDNPANPIFQHGRLLWNRYVLESISWFRMQRAAESAESYFFVHGIYPTSVSDLMNNSAAGRVSDPWGRTYAIATTGNRLQVSGTDWQGEASPKLIVVRQLAWEGASTPSETGDRAGVRLID